MFQESKRLQKKLKKNLNIGDYEMYWANYYIGKCSLDLAHHWHTKAALLKNPIAMVEEGDFIIHGWVPGTLKDAFSYFKKASELGEKAGFRGVAECYFYGWGVDSDLEKAKKFMKLAGRKNKIKYILKMTPEEFKKVDGKQVLKIDREVYN